MKLSYMPSTMADKESGTRHIAQDRQRQAEGCGQGQGHPSNGSAGTQAKDFGAVILFGMSPVMLFLQGQGH